MPHSLPSLISFLLPSFPSLPLVPLPSLPLLSPPLPTGFAPPKFVELLTYVNSLSSCVIPSSVAIYIQNPTLDFRRGHRSSRISLFFATNFLLFFVSLSHCCERIQNSEFKGLDSIEIVGRVKYSFCIRRRALAFSGKAHVQHPTFKRSKFDQRPFLPIKPKRNTQEPNQRVALPSILIFPSRFDPQKKS